MEWNIEAQKVMQENEIIWFDGFDRAIGKGKIGSNIIESFEPEHPLYHLRSKDIYRKKEEAEN